LASLLFVVFFASFGFAFVWPAWRACGAFPAPLDDVYIHADFARATAHGHPFEWVAGQGYSSGETAPLYAFLLAPGTWLGLDDERIVAFAFALAVVALALAANKVGALVRTSVGVTPGLALGVAASTGLLWLSVGTIDFTFFSGMESAVFFACAVAGLAAAEQSRLRTVGRKRAALHAGAWGAAMVLLRPEAIVLVVLFALLAGRGARSMRVWPMLLRAALPGAFATAAVLVANRIWTGDYASAGARLKLLGSNPFLDDVTRAKELVLNLLSFYWKVLLAEVGPVGLTTMLALVGFGIWARRTRHATFACAFGGLAFALLVSTNGAARYQGFRYYAPALALFTVGCALGASALGHALRARAIGPLLLAGLALVTMPRAAEARRYFARASANIHEQQVTMGKKIARELPQSAIVMVGDAGAIPFFSKRTSIDALGLGGYLERPFVRAAVHGEAATLELLEHLPHATRPTHLALYPNWFPLTTGLFGKEIGRVTIEDNVICGGPTKVLYEAHFDALGDGDAVDAGFPPPSIGVPIDTIDFADVESELAHATRLPTPNGGYTVGKVARVGAGTTVRFDGGRILGHGREVSFVVRGVGAPRTRTLVVRGDEGGFRLEVEPSRECETLTAEKSPGAFTHARCEVFVGDGDRIALRASDGEARVFHAWIAAP
jgi:hypothetical protein